MSKIYFLGKTLITRLLNVSPSTFLPSFFFSWGLEGKSIFEMDSRVRFSPSPASGRKHDL